MLNCAIVFGVREESFGKPRYRESFVSSLCGALSDRRMIEVGRLIRKISAVVCTILALCNVPSMARENRTQVFDFEKAAANTVPPGFQTGMTGVWKATQWSVQEKSGNRVMAHIGFWNEDPDGVFPVCWIKKSKARDLTLSVRLFAVRPPTDIPGAVHDGAGIVVRFTDLDNYYLLRAVPLESRVRLYKVVDGKRFTLAGKNLQVQTDRWHDLGLKISGSRFTAYLNGNELFRHHDTTFRHAGAFGLWSKPNNVTYFDDLIAKTSN